MHPEDLPHMLELFKRAIASETPYHFEQRLRRFDGEYRWFDNRGVPVRDDTGRIARWYVLLTDIEDRTRALARLEQMQSDFAHMNRVSMMGELAASLSHEITQPIASARNNARAALNFLDRSLPDLGEVREALSCVVDDTDRAGDIVDRIRDNIKKAPPRKDYFDLNAAINEVIVLARSAINKNGVSVQARPCRRIISCSGRSRSVAASHPEPAPERVRSNGLERRGGTEFVDQHRARPRRRPVAVRDSGPGIDPAHLRACFRCILHHEIQWRGYGALDLPVDHCRPWGPAVGRGERTSRRRISIHLARRANEIMNFLHSFHRPRELREDTV